MSLIVVCVPTASAQDPEPDDAVLKLAEPDFALLSLPTSLRVPKYKSAFRVTHRFTRPLNGGFGDVAGDLFGLDTGAQIGLEYRFGIIPNGQIGLHRTSSGKTVEFFAQYGVLRQGRSPVDVSALISIEGTNNFKDSYSPAIGAVISRIFGTRAALYVEPIWVNNTNPIPKEVVNFNNTFMIGVGGRVRIRPTVYLLGEIGARAQGYHPGVNHASFGFEKRAGGHIFQLNFSNAFGTTLAQIARGGFNNEDWYMGFNLSRKFF